VGSDPAGAALLVELAQLEPGAERDLDERSVCAADVDLPPRAVATRSIRQFGSRPPQRHALRRSSVGFVRTSGREPDEEQDGNGDRDQAPAQQGAQRHRPG
jgi:hypothetical protein